jgi:acetyl esterase/lipase
MMGSVKLTSNVVYARHGIGHMAGEPRERDMLMDVYEPSGDASGGSRPAVVLAFGGAFHRGSKEADSFSVGETSNTAAAEYARRWAEQGYVTFSIDYRLIPEDPKPDENRVLASGTTLTPDRAQSLRAQMGLPPATSEMLVNGVESGAMDAAAAVAFIRRNAALWRVDTSRIALWGWSAGARNMLYAAFGRKSEAAAVIALSTGMHEQDLARMIPTSCPRPAVLLAEAERDFPFVTTQTPGMVRWMRERLPIVRRVTVLDRDHFYPADSPVQVDDAVQEGATLMDAMTDFLHATIGKPVGQASCEIAGE